MLKTHFIVFYIVHDGWGKLLVLCRRLGTLASCDEAHDVLLHLVLTANRVGAPLW